MAKFTHTLGTTLGTKKPRSKVNRSHEHILTMEVGEVTPIMVDLIYPGDEINLDIQALLRQTTLQTPPFGRSYISIGVYFVPFWQIWDDFFTFFGENKDEWFVKEKPTIPQLTAPSGGWEIGTLADHFGWPTKINNVSVTALKARGYAKIINDHYRDQNLQKAPHINFTSTDTEGSNGDNYITDLEKAGKPFIAGKTEDYFTSALPSAQKGEPTGISIAGEIPVITKTAGTPLRNLPPITWQKTDGSTWKPDETTVYTMRNELDGEVEEVDGYAGNPPATAVPIGTKQNVFPGNLYADGSKAIATNVNEIRLKFTEQQLKEIDAIYGTRYNEYLYGHWDVKTSQIQINKAEFIGGSVKNMDIHQVPQTSQTTTGNSGSPQATLTALGQTEVKGKRINKAFDQHGYLYVLATIKYPHTYSQGIKREDKYINKEDFLDPAMNNIGNQPIYNYEIYADGSNTDIEIFGYKEAWQEARETNSYTSGLMRPQAQNTLGLQWTYADKYDKLPTLSSDWIREDKTNINRTLAVTNQPAFFGEFRFNYKINRNISVYSIPGLTKM